MSYLNEENDPYLKESQKIIERYQVIIGMFEETRMKIELLKQKGQLDSDESKIKLDSFYNDFIKYEKELDLVHEDSKNLMMKMMGDN